MTRTITPSTTAQRERVVVSSVLDNSGVEWPVHVLMAISYAPTYWDDPVAGRIANACMMAYRRSRPTVAEYLKREDHAWLAHPSFNCGLPFALADIEAKDLALRYKGKRLAELIGTAYSDVQAKPELAKELAMSLKLRLEEWLS
jgi:hypothetical protein